MTHRGPFQPLPYCDSVILRFSQQSSEDRRGQERTGEEKLQLEAGSCSGAHVQKTQTWNCHIFQLETRTAVICSDPSLNSKIIPVIWIWMFSSDPALVVSIKNMKNMLLNSNSVWIDQENKKRWLLIPPNRLFYCQATFTGFSAALSGSEPGKFFLLIFLYCSINIYRVCLVQLFYLLAFSRL